MQIYTRCTFLFVHFFILNIYNSFNLVVAYFSFYDVYQSALVIEFLNRKHSTSPTLTRLQIHWFLNICIYEFIIYFGDKHFEDKIPKRMCNWC